MGASAAGSRSGMNDRKSNNAHLWHEPRQDAGVVNRDVIVNYDAEEIERGLKAHNDYRREQGASDMLYMVISLTKFWSLAASEVVKMTTSDVATHQSVVKYFFGGVQD